MIELSSINVERHVAPVDQKFVDGVLELVSKNVTSLSMTHPPANHPKFEAYRVALLLEFKTYLGMTPPNRIELVTISAGNVILGFTLCGLPLNGSNSECGIYYTAVAAKVRGSGLMRLMMNDITSRYSKVGLSCDVALVPRYERFGFRCVSMRHHQVVMFLGDPIEETPVLSTPNLMEHPSVIFELQKAAENHSYYELERADNALKKKLKADEENAKRFLKARIAR